MLYTLDLKKTLDQETYEQDLVKYQIALSELGSQVYAQQRPVAILFEGWDASGKGGIIRRVTEVLDPRGYMVYAIAAPEGEEVKHHYLWRFWRLLPEAGQIAIFDRSWYGRVLADRIVGFCSEPEWKRAYREINQFERQLVDFGMILLKFFIHISKDEQDRRFELREDDLQPYRRLSAHELRSQENWGQYEEAVNDMLLKTSTINAPWILVEGNSENYAQIKVLQTLVEVLGKELDNNALEKRKSAEKKKGARQ